MKGLIRTIRMDLNRLLLCRRYYYCIAGMALTLLFSGINYMKMLGSHVMLWDCYEEATSGGFALMFYMLCVVGGGLDYCMDMKNRYIRYETARCGICNYAISRTFVSAVSGFLSMFLGQIIFSCLMAACLIMENGISEKLLSSGSGLGGMFWDMVIFSLLGSVLSVLGLFVTTFIPNIFVGMASPVLFYYIVITLTNKHWKTEVFMPSCIYFSASVLFGGGIRHFAYALLVSLCLIWIMYRGILRQMERRCGNV